MAVIGLDLGGTKLAGAVFSASGEIIRKETRPLEKRNGGDVGALITSLVREFLESAHYVLFVIQCNYYSSF